MSTARTVPVKASEGDCLFPYQKEKKIKDAGRDFTPALRRWPLEEGNLRVCCAADKAGRGRGGERARPIPSTPAPPGQSQTITHCSPAELQQPRAPWATAPGPRSGHPGAPCFVDVGGGAATPVVTAPPHPD